MAQNFYMEPLDTLFFRDSRPFQAGVDVYAESTLPYPMTLFGAIGGHILDLHGDSLADYIGNKSAKLNAILGEYSHNLSEGNLRVKGPFLTFGGKTYFCVPKNLWEHEISKTALVLKPVESGAASASRRSNLNNISIMNISHDGYEESAGFLDTEAMESYLKDTSLGGIIIRDDNYFFDRETKAGHQLNAASGTVEPEQLYFASHLRFCDRYEQRIYKKSGLLAVVDGVSPDIFSEKTMLFSGERRGVKLTINNDCTDNQIPDTPDILLKIKEKKRFSLYLATPAVFDMGWKRSSWPGPLGKAQFVAAAVGKPNYMSGWKKSGNGSAGGPRPMRRLAPAGSVYFFTAYDLDDTTLQDLYTTYHCNQSISDEYPVAGFGTAFVGAW